MEGAADAAEAAVGGRPRRDGDVVPLFNSAVRSRRRRWIASRAVFTSAGLGPANHANSSPLPVNLSLLLEPLGRISRVPRCSTANTNATVPLS